MSDMASLDAEVEAKAKLAKKIEADGEKIERHSLKELTEANDQLSSTAAVKTKKRGLILTKFQPPGST